MVAEQKSPSPKLPSSSPNCPAPISEETESCCVHSDESKHEQLGRCTGNWRRYKQHLQLAARSIRPYLFFHSLQAVKEALAPRSCSCSMCEEALCGTNEPHDYTAKEHLSLAGHNMKYTTTKRIIKDAGKRKGFTLNPKQKQQRACFCRRQLRQNRDPRRICWCDEKWFSYIPDKSKCFCYADKDLPARQRRKKNGGQAQGIQCNYGEMRSVRFRV